MPAVQLQVQPRTAPRGTKLAFATADFSGLGNSFPNDGTVLLLVAAPASNLLPANLVVKTPVRMDNDLNVADRKYVVAPGETWLLGPFPAEYYNNGNKAVVFNTDQPLDVAAITGS